MMRAMLWKEYREHRNIWLAMAMVNGGILYGLTSLEELWGLPHRDDKLLMLGPAAVLLIWAYGMVCGAMLLAGEREGATLDFLDALPVTRLRLWMVKGPIGLLLLGGQVIVLCGWLAALAPPDARHLALLFPYVLGILISGATGMAYGLFFSARGENVLNTIGLTFVGQIVAVIAASFLSFIILAALQIISFWLNGQQRGPHIFTGGAFNVLLVLVYVALTLAAIAGSARIFSRVDRLRGGEAEQVIRPRGASVWASWRRLLWLSYNQMRRLILGMILFALGLGFLLPVAGPVVWPALTLLIGVLCGVTVFGDEQLHGSFRFLGDQRFPLGRVWFVKVGMRFALAVSAAFLLILPSLILTIVHEVESHALSEQRPPFFGTMLHSVLVGPVVPVGIHLTMWLLYGFTVGHLCGLLFRKSLVAGVVSLGWSALLVSLWVPSLLGIGLHFWQVAGAPVILLGAAWLLMPAWAADRLAARGTFVRLGVALAAAGLWTAGGLWYRVAEVPEVPDRFDMPAFVARLPSMDDNEAGQAIRGAWSSIDKLTSSFTARRADPPLPPNVPVENPLFAPVSDVLEHGWPAGESELGDWLDQHFQQEDQEKWLGPLTKAADCPVGVVEYVKNMTIDNRLGHWINNAVLFNQLLAVRGLQQQARGDQKTFVDYLRIGLAVSRNMQNLSHPFLVFRGRDVEKVWPPALDLWLAKLQGPPDKVSEQLERVAAALRRHEAELPDEEDLVKVDYLIALNSLDHVPDKLLEFTISDRPKEKDASLRQAELYAAALMWRIPWERERHQRILRAAFEGDARQLSKAEECGAFILSGGHNFRRISTVFATRGKHSKRDLAQLRVAQLKAALRWYQAKTGKLPDTLDALVPRYLPSIPADPFDNKLFRYRLSRGEKIGWVDAEKAAGAPGQAGGAPGAAPGGAPGAPLGGAAGAPPGMFGVPRLPTRFVPDGQGILWSVGEDGHDDGGVKQGKNSGTMFGEDIIFLVPPPE